MHGLIMDFQLTIPTILRRCEQLHYDREVVTRLPDKSIHRYTYGDMIRRAKRLSLALQRLGIKQDDRVATFCWNHYQHLEAYMAIPCMGAVLHTLNLRLHPNDLTYIADHAGDKAIIVDEVLWDLFEKFRDTVPSLKHVIVVRATDKPLPPGTLDYEALLAAEDETKFEYPDLDERQAAAMCYTSGTTGMPKGVLATHRAITLHSLASGLTDSLGLREHDTVMAVVPMFHANAWGMPFTCVMIGAKQVFPGPHLDPPSLLELMEQERVTVTGGVPTIWLGMLQILDADPKKYDLSSVRAVVTGGSAAPRSMIEGFEERHGLNILHSWGMTELCPLGTVGSMPQRLTGKSKDEKYAFKSKQGRPCPMVEIRARNENGLVPWDGVSMGELEVRGPWIASGYYNRPDAATSFTDDGWFRTGDIVAIDAVRLPAIAGPRQGRHQERRRVDQLGGAGERPDGTSGRGRGRRDSGLASQVGRAAAGDRGAQERTASQLRGADRVHQAPVCQVVAPRRHRLRQRNPPHQRRQVPEDSPAREVRRLLRKGRGRKINFKVRVPCSRPSGCLGICVPRVCQPPCLGTSHWWLRHQWHRHFRESIIRRPRGRIEHAKVNLSAKLSEFAEHWSPRIVGELNGQHVKLVKVQGEFVWHQHADEDEMFLVIQGRLHMDYRDSAGRETSLELSPGEFVIVPRGTEHRPSAVEETHVLLFEPAGTLNTGNVRNELTVENPVVLTP